MAAHAVEKCTEQIHALSLEGEAEPLLLEVQSNLQ